MSQLTIMSQTMLPEEFYLMLNQYVYVSIVKSNYHPDPTQKKKNLKNKGRRKNQLDFYPNP